MFRGKKYKRDGNYTIDSYLYTLVSGHRYGFISIYSTDGRVLHRRCAGAVAVGPGWGGDCEVYRGILPNCYRFINVPKSLTQGRACRCGSQ